MKYSNNLTQLEKRISNQYDTLSARLKQVAHFIVNNKNSVAFNTIATISEEADVPPSTLIRFAQALGYKGFNEIKQIYRMELLDSESNYLTRVKLVKKNNTDNSTDKVPQFLLKEIANASSKSLQNLENSILEADISRAVEAMGQASRIYIIGFGRSFGIASYLSYSLNRLQMPTCLIHGLGETLKEQVSMMQEGDLLIAISFMPYAEDTLVACDMANKKGVKRLVITDQHISPLASKNDICLVVKETKFRDAFRTLAASQSLVQALCVSLIYEKNK